MSLRAGIVGGPCERHVRALKGIDIVGVADPEARRAAEKLGVKTFASLDELIAAGANVIHVLAAPRAKLAIAALEQGCHVLIETPVAEDADDVVRIARVARERGLTASVVHPFVTRTARGDVEIVRDQELPPYQGGPTPRAQRDAGDPFRESGTQSLLQVQALLGPIEHVDVEWRSTGSEPNLAFDDWRAVVRCQRGTGKIQLRWGAKRSRKLWRKDELRDVVVDFYRRLAAGDPPRVSMEDAARVTLWVEKVARAAAAEHDKRLARFTLSPSVPYLVTGANGSLGAAVVRRLLADGRVRAMVRRIPERPIEGVEYCFGNLGDPEAVDRAVKGARKVVHAGAAMKGGWPEHLGGTIVGTQNVVDACLRHGIEQLVYISSMSVVDWAGSSGGAPVSETTALEPRPEERGLYTRAKLEAEQIVSESVGSRRLPAVILRPGQIFGGGIPLVNGAVARRAGGRWLVLGDGRLTLPLVYIDDVVDAIRAAIDRQLGHGEIIQLVDRDLLTQDEVLALAGARAVHVPRRLVLALGKLSELALPRSPIARYRLESALARLTFESDRAEQLLGWQPKVGVREGIRRVNAAR